MFIQITAKVVIGTIFYNSNVTYVISKENGNGKQTEKYILHSIIIT